MRMLLLLFMLGACADAGPRGKKQARRPPPAGTWTAGSADQVIAARVYPSSGLTRVCLRYRYSADGQQPLRLEIDLSKRHLLLSSAGTHCELFAGVKEGDEARLVLDAPLTAELTGELYIEDANP